MRTFGKAFLLCLPLLAMSCSTVSVQYDYDPGFDFARLRTYDWMPLPASAEISPLTVQRIQKAVDGQLVAKGFMKRPGNPDFLIATHIGRQDKIRVTDWGYGYRGWGGGVSVSQYQEGTLILDFIETQSKELIWRSIATATIYRGQSPQEQQERANKGAKEIFKNFPPKP
jgi:hypothetical protein